MPILPEQYGRTGAYELLSAAARGHVAFDKRLIAALTAAPDSAIPDLVRFSREDRSEDRVDVSFDLLHLFACMPTPEAVPFLIGEMRRNPDDASAELIDLANRVGAPAAAALLDLFEEKLGAHSEILFVALMAGAAGARVEQAIAAVSEADPDDGAFLREIAATGYDRSEAQPEFEYPDEAEPDLTGLPEKEREEFLVSESAEFRLMAAASYLGEELSDRRRQQFLALGKSDPDARVRGAAWEALREETGNAGVLTALTARLKVAGDAHERACIANALASHIDEIEGLAEAIEAAYGAPEHRAKALEAMWRSLDRRWVDRPPLHLDDPNVELRRQAILATGYFRLHNQAKRLEPFFLDPGLREDALYAYALAAPADETRFGLRQLEKRIEGLAGGLGEEDEEAIRFALDMRLEMSGRSGSVAAKEDAGNAAASTPKVGRNDPCPCGSGRKFKKCCGVTVQ